MLVGAERPRDFYQLIDRKNIPCVTIWVSRGVQATRHSGRGDTGNSRDILERRTRYERILESAFRFHIRSTNSVRPEL